MNDNAVSGLTTESNSSTNLPINENGESTQITEGILDFANRYGYLYERYIHVEVDIAQLIQELQIEIITKAAIFVQTENPVEKVKEFAEGILIEPNLSTLLLLTLFMNLGIQEESDENRKIKAKEIKIITNYKYRVSASHILKNPPGEKYRKPNDHLASLGIEIVSKGRGPNCEYWLQKINTNIKDKKMN